MFLKLPTLKVIKLVLNFKSYFAEALEKCDVGNSVNL